MIDFFHALARGPLVEVQAMAAGTGRPDANFTASCRFADGTLATLTYTTLGSRRVPKEHVEVFLGNEVAVIDDFRTARIYNSSIRSGLRQGCDKGIAQEWDAFHRACIEGGPPLIPLETLRSVSEATFRIRSLASGC
jgi:hypothetical protein